MCTQPLTFETGTAACRRCDECLRTRTQSWVARACAERATARHALSITLTYANLEDGSRPDGSRTFVYSDVQKFYKLLREQFYRTANRRLDLRYISCGEIGSRGTQRVHWHCILFADDPLIALGKWKTFPARRPVAHKELVQRQNYLWDLWPHGHVQFSLPDQRDIAYALSYVTKEQSTVARSLGMVRESTARNWAGTFFAMSKRPPIGWRYFRQYWARHYRKLTLPPSLDIQVPGRSGYWWLSGIFREEALRIASEIVYHRERKGLGRPSTFVALVRSLSVNHAHENEPNPDLEGLLYGAKLIRRQRAVAREAADPGGSLEARRPGAERFAKRQRQISDALRNCAGPLPCKACRRGASQSAADQARDRYWSNFWDWFTAENKRLERVGEPLLRPSEALKGRYHREFATAWRGRFEVNPGCGLRDHAQEQLKGARAIRDLERAVQGAATSAAFSPGDGLPRR